MDPSPSFSQRWFALAVISLTVLACAETEPAPLGGGPAADGPVDTPQAPVTDGPTDTSPDVGHDTGMDAADAPIADASPDSGDSAPEVGRLDGPPLVAARSFAFDAHLTIVGNNPLPQGANYNGRLPEWIPMTIHVDPSGPGVSISLSGGGEQMGVTVEDGIDFTTVAPIKLHLRDVMPCGARLEFDPFSFSATNDRISGAVDGRAYVAIGDVQHIVAVRLTFEGGVDTIPPNLGADRTDVDPMTGLFLPANEALATGSAASLTAGPETVALVPRIPSGTSLVVGFDKPATALRYGTTYALVVTPFVDLAGNAGQAPPTLTTLTPRPVLPEDGFETPVGATGARIFGAEQWPTLAGDRSAMLGPNDYFSRRMTVRMSVSSGDTAVRMLLRPVASQPGAAGASGNAVRIGVPGGPIVAAALSSTENLTVGHVGPNGQQLWFGETRPLEIALPPGVASEVIVDAEVWHPPNCGLPQKKVGYVLDDIRVE